MSERKYGHRGYLEDERPESRSRGPRREKRGPGGRGLGRPTATRVKCARCGAGIDPAGDLEADAICNSCGADLHACTNCRHFDTSARFECRAEIEVRIRQKATRNDCRLFELRQVREHAAEGGDDDPKAAFDALFDF